MADQITFSTFDLIVDEKRFCEELANLLTFKESLYSDPKSKFAYKIKYESTKNGMWIESNFGQVAPKSPDYINRETGEERSNMREADEFEPNNQFFAYYDFSKKTLYLSQPDKKGVLKKALQEHLNKPITIKTIFVNIDEFLGKLKYLTKAKLTAYRELLSAEDDLFRSSADIWGFDSLKQCTFEAEFYTDDQRNIPDKIKDLFLKTKSGKIGDLVCIGKDEEDLDIVLNLDSFTQKVKVFGTKDDLGFWIPNTVKLELLKELEK